MYVADITSLVELELLLAEARREWNIHPTERNGWDIEDIIDRIEELRE